MTPPAIVMKLNAFLADPVDSECKVVYLLCEVRKLLERVPPPQRPFALNMYCHWALHVDLNGKDTIEPFLQQVDAHVDGVLNGHMDLKASDRMIREFALLDAFRSQLRDFLRANGIRSDVTDDDAHWNDFVRHYAGVIEDGSLALSPKHQGIVKHVRELTFTKGRNAIGTTLLPFDMTWSAELLNGQFLDITVNARPSLTGGQALLHCGVSMR